MSSPVYLDYNATTPTDPRVVESMNRSQVRLWKSGQPARLWKHGAEGMDEARAGSPNLIDFQPGEVVFTSGATE